LVLESLEDLVDHPVLASPLHRLDLENLYALEVPEFLVHLVDLLALPFLLLLREPLHLKIMA
jgi:hypothetical protein